MILGRPRRPGVCAQSPPLRCRVVDRAPHQRMAEAVAARHVGRRQQRRAQQRIQRRQRGALLKLGGRDRDIEDHRVAHHRRGAGEALRVVGQRSYLLVERQRDAARYVSRAQPPPLMAIRAASSCK